MAKKKNSILSFLMAVSLILTLTCITSPVFATETDAPAFQSTDSYVLEFGVGVSPYAYFSPFVPLLTYDGYKVDGYSILFGLKNTETGEISEVAYCTDMPVDATIGAKYRPLNLTDSTYAATHASKLHSIVSNSYPYVNLETLSAAAGIEGLSMCEAITGTQLAVWKAAHGDTIEIIDFLYKSNAGVGNSGHSTDDERNAYNSGSDEYKATVKANIEALYNYLMALPEQPSLSTVVSNASFTKHDTPQVTNNGDGTYRIQVSTDITVPANSSLQLTAYLANGTYYTTVQNVTSGEYTLTIDRVPTEYAFGTVTLSLDGRQTLDEDVYLLDADGIRGVSQSFIACLSGEVPVHADVKAEPDRVLTIHKADRTEDKTPLSNISFEIYYVGSVDDFRDGKLSIDTAPTEEDLKKYAVSKRLVGTITTDVNGYGSLNFSTEDGVYLVKELPNDLVEDSVAFFVSLPDYARLDSTGAPTYTITATPKNSLKEEKVGIEKDVAELDNEHGTYDIGQEHTWIIQSSIPAAIALAKEYSVRDTLDSRLTLVAIDKVALAKDNGTFGNAEDLLYQKDETETPLGGENLMLIPEEDYAITIRKTDTGADDFSVRLTAVGMKKIAAAMETDDTYELRIYFTAYINQTATIGETIPNQAQVSYTNQLNKTYETVSDRPEVHTGGAQFVKVDSQDSSKTLSGASFSLYREATEQDLAQNTDYTTVVIGDTPRKLIPVAFYAAPDLSGEKVLSVTTEADGRVYLYGLAYGDYYLMESSAPAGYNKLKEPVKFTISESSHTEQAAIRIENTSGVLLPETGGMGTQLFTIGGLVLIVAALCLLVTQKRLHR